jgi:hypothetical protein
MLSRNPGLSPEDVKYFIKASAQDLGGPGPDNKFGHGRIDAQAALVLVPPSSGDPAPPRKGENRAPVPERVRQIKVGAIAFDNADNMYVVYTNQHKLVKYHLAEGGDISNASSAIATTTYGGTPLYYPLAVAVSSAGDRVCVADTHNHRVVIFNKDLGPVQEIDVHALAWEQRLKYRVNEWFGLVQKTKEEVTSFYPPSEPKNLVLPRDVRVTNDNKLLVLDGELRLAAKFCFRPDGIAEPEMFKRPVNQGKYSNNMLYEIAQMFTWQDIPLSYATYSNYIKLPGNAGESVQFARGSGILEELAEAQN